MATDKNTSEPLSVEQRLKSLYELQTILSEIDRIKTIRGELPLEVKDLEDNIEGLKTRIDNYTREIDELHIKLVTEKEKINEAESKSPDIRNSLTMCVTTANLISFPRKWNSRHLKSNCAKNT